MKRIGLGFLVFIFIISACFITSCNNDKNDNQNDTEIADNSQDKNIGNNDESPDRIEEKEDTPENIDQKSHDGQRIYYEFTGYNWDSEPFYRFINCASPFLVIKDNKYGAINEFGEEIIKLKYTRLESFSEGYAVAGDGDKLLYVDLEGNEYSKPEWEEIYGFSEGLAAVKISGKYGYIDKKLNVVIEPVYDEARSFSENVALVKSNNKRMFIDKSGKWLFDINDDVEFVSSFIDGMCAIFNDNGRQGFINKKGEIVIPMEWDVMGHDAPSFKDGYVILWKDTDIDTCEGYKYYRDGIFEHYDTIKYSEQGSYERTYTGDIISFEDQNTLLYGFRGKNGRTVIEPKFRIVDEFEDCFSDFTFVEYNNYWGIIDKQGEFVVKPQFASYSFRKLSEDNRIMVSVYNQNKIGYIIMKYEDEYDTPPASQWNNFDEGDSFEITYADEMNALEDYGYIACEGSYKSVEYDELQDNEKKIIYVCNESYQFGALDENGSLVIPMEYDYISSFKNGFAVARKGSNYCFIDSSYKQATEAEYDMTGNFNDGHALVMKENKYGYLNTDMSYFIEPVCDYASEFSNGAAYVAINGERKIINTRGETVKEFSDSYNVISELKFGYFAATCADELHIIDRNGDIVKITEPSLKFMRDDDVIIWHSEAEPNKVCAWFMEDNTTTDYYDSILDVYLDYMVVTKNDITYVIDKNNNILYELNLMQQIKTNLTDDKYLYIGDVNGEKTVVIDRDNNVTKVYDYNLVSRFSDGLAVIYDNRNLFGYIDETSNVVIQFKFTDAADFSDIIDNLAYVSTPDGKAGLINTQGDIVIEHDVIIVSKSKLWNGNFVIISDNDKCYIYVK